MTMIEYLLGNIGRTLRVIAGPFLALVIIWLIDPNHNIIIAVTQTTGAPATEQSLNWKDLQSWWPIAGLVVAGGLCVYHVHRAIPHPLLSWLILRVIRRTPSWIGYIREEKGFPWIGKARQILLKVLYLLVSGVASIRKDNDDLRFERWHSSPWQKSVTPAKLYLTRGV